MFELFDCDEQGSATADITRASIIDTEDRLGIMLDAMPLGVLIHSQHAIVYANAGCCSLLGESRSNLTGKHFLDFLQSDERFCQFEQAFAVLGKTIECEAVVVNSATGCERLMKIILGRLHWDGLPVVQILLQDITDQKRAENSLRKLSITDELTGAYNRRHAFYEAGLYMEHVRDVTSPFSIALLDIDHFKNINDRYGHAVGDEVLKGFTERGHRFLATSNMDSAIFARIGGEEFLILAPGFALRQVTDLAERLRTKLAAHPFKSSKGPVQVTASMGVSQRVATDTCFETILNRADEALYRAKEEGRNRVVAAA